MEEESLPARAWGRAYKKDAPGGRREIIKNTAVIHKSNENQSRIDFSWHPQLKTDLDPESES